jgi:transposase
MKGVCVPTKGLFGPVKSWQTGDVFLKRHVRRKNGKEHVYYSLAESIRVSGSRTIQRRVLNLGELNTTQIEGWQRSIEVIEKEGQSRQYRLFTDREGGAPAHAADVCEVVLSSLAVRCPRQFGACWLASRLWQELKLDEFFSVALHDRRGSVEWAKVIELLAVNRLIDPESELGIHQRWYGTTAMDVILGTDDAVAAKDRLYRALDKAIEHKEALERHLAKRWEDLFGAQFDLLLYDLTSTYFEGQAGEIPAAKHGYSRDHRPDARQIILAMVVTEEGFPLSYEVFEGNRADVTTLEEILDSVERKHGALGRVWVFDRGIVSEENLALLRKRGALYLIATPKRQLANFQKELVEEDWSQVRDHPQIQVKLLERDKELYVLTRSLERAEKERAMRTRVLRGLRQDLAKLSKSVRTGRLRNRDLIHKRLGRLEERWPAAWPYLKSVELTDRDLIWSWDRKKLRNAWLHQGTYLLRTNLIDRDPQKLWRQYVQLTEVESVFRTLKSELNLRPIWHRIQLRVEAHILIAFLGYCLWICLKQKLRAAAGSLTPAQVIHSLKHILLVEVWFDLRKGGRICLPRITQPEAAQQLILHHLGWSLPEQPPPTIYRDQNNFVWTT